MKIDRTRLQHAFSKHAVDFGVTGNWSPAAAALFEKALHDHVASPTVQKIKGTYRGNIAVTHYFDPANDLNVMVDAADEFVGGWRLSPAQKRYLTTTGNVQ